MPRTAAACVVRNLQSNSTLWVFRRPVKSRLVSALLPWAFVCTGCVSPALDGLSTAACLAARDCPANATCAAGVCRPQAAEQCDGADNDGDDRIDEDFDLQTSTAHCGACDSPCEGRCVGGECIEGDVGVETDGGCLPVEETCNGTDDDCDGETDEDLLNACGTCGPPPVETCNALDDDCDGATDEDLPVCNGSCVIPPEAPCNGVDDDCNGAIDDAMEPEGGCSACLPEETACDGLDEDCDGTNDDGLLNACGLCGDVPAESCNGLDDDCNGRTDDVAPPDDVPCAAGTGACERAGEWTCPAVPESGVEAELRCDATPGQPDDERCGNAVDDDCDGETDEGFETLGAACAVGQGICAASGVFVCGPEGTPICDAVMATPQPEQCDLLDNNCDGRVDETFDVSTDAENCGRCGRRCAVPNAVAACSGGECGVDRCEDGFLDLDQRPDNGCECEPSAADPPDPLGLDTNCDGVDGTAAASVFVSSSRGDDCTPTPGNPDPCPGLDPGTRAQPVRTLARALALAEERGHAFVLLDQGDYSQSPAYTIRTSLGLHGGYLFEPVTRTWTRPSVPQAATRLSAGRLRGEPTLIIEDGADVVLDRLFVDAPAAGAGLSSVALFASQCAAVHVVHSVIVAGDAGSGASGTAAGLPPALAELGGAGADGAGGPGGRNPDCPEGTAGGTGGDGTPSARGVPGLAGEAGAVEDPLTPPALGGDGAADPQTPAIGGADAPPGLPGLSGQPGSPGGALTDAFAWSPASGEPPVRGRHGGGGGGGGGGLSSPVAGFMRGPAGGGGGAGGCAGLPGANGSGGAASVGILVAGQCLVRLVGTEVRTGLGGTGGAGTPGTAGARGRLGGAAELPGRTGPDDVAAAVGGRGGDGGCGGNGAGGSGGPSVGILRVLGAPLPELDPTSIVTPGIGGIAGEGSVAPAACRGAPSDPGADGLAGVSRDIGCCVDPADCGRELNCPEF
jgi:hypothetical protein